jgi:methyl-accepting chemotaxis protein
MTLHFGNSIKKKIVILSSVILLFGIGTPTIISFYNTRKAIIEATIKESHQITTVTRKNLQSWLEGRKKEIEKFGQKASVVKSLGTTFIAKMAIKEASIEMKLEVKSNPYLSEVSITSDDGNIIVSSNDNRIGANVKKLTHFQSALKGDTVITSPRQKAGNDMVSFYIATPVLKNNVPVGVVISEVSLNIFAAEFIDYIKIGQSGFIFVIDETGKVIVSPKATELNDQNLLSFDWGKELFKTKNGTYTFNWQNTPKTVVFSEIPLTGWIAIALVEQSEINALARSTAITNLIIAVFILIIAVVLSIFVANRISQPLEKAVDITEQLKDGNFIARLDTQTNDEVGKLSHSINSLATDLNSAINDINWVMSQVASGDLSQRITVMVKGDLDKLKQNINTSIEVLNQTLSQVASTSEQVNTSSSEMMTSAQNLSNGANQQAANLQQTSSSMGHVESMAKTNNEKAELAQQLTKKTLETVQRGDQQMNEMLKTMDDINNTSSDISKIIKVIDEIAFQTNLLALNAAVEAARAGTYGKGFAVVAEEVRNLAARSAEAAKDTTSLIENSVKEIGRGVESAGKTANNLNEISEVIAEVNNIVLDIAAASNEQMKGIEEINKGVSQVNTIVQQNSSISEQTASASNEQAAQANKLKQLMKRFVLNSMTADVNHPKLLEEPSQAPKMLM